jgi:3-hydroxybutyryl-CoA dehydrogenase
MTQAHSDPIKDGRGLSIDPRADNWPGQAAVIGAGLMGRRIAGTLAAAGVDVRLTDVRAEVLDDARMEAEDVARSLAGAKDDFRPGRIITVSSVEEAAAEADFVTEAIIEDLAAKNSLFDELRSHAPKAVLASNSSVLRVTDIAKGVARPELIVGTHWWNPPDLIPIVEVIQGHQTRIEVVHRVMDFMKRAGKTPVWVRKDVPGFIGNRLQHALWREALSLVEAGVADADTVDLVVRKTLGLRLGQMGPLKNADYIGIDLTVAIHAAVLPYLDRSTEPNMLLRDLLSAGQLGAKTGRGLLPWPDGAREEARLALASHVVAALAQQSGTA